jgi:ketosteroid isomerase-like protein
MIRPRLAHRRLRALLLACAFLSSAISAIFGAETSVTAREVTALLTAQAAAWNRADLAGFMQGYAPTDALRFASGGSITRGWRATLENYRKAYPDKAAMGTLAFSDLEITELAPDAAIAFGRWKLTHAATTSHGLFTLTLRKTPAGWRIIHDHTSDAKE